MTYGIINEQGRIVGVISTIDPTRITENCKPLTGLTEYEISQNQCITWDFKNETWVITDMPPEPPPVDPNEQRKEALRIAGFTKEQIGKIIALDRFVA